MSTQIGFSKEEQAFWICSTCENELINCECGTKQDVAELRELSTNVFGTPRYPIDVKYDPKIEKVVVKSKSYIELEEDFELSKLKDLGFYICFIKSSQMDGLVIHLRRI